jgi:Kef-type K+ transport system membrane component KefB
VGHTVVVTAQTEFILSLFVLLSVALLAGELALRLGQIALVGQLLAGILLGPYLLGPYYGITVHTGVSSSLTAIQLLATFLILFMAGMEMGPEDIYGMERGTLLTGIGIFLVPFAACFAVAYFVLPGLSLLLLLFIAVTLSITALPIMGIMIAEFGLAGKKFGRMAMTVALVNELSAITVFAILLQIYNGGGHPTVTALALAVGSVALFLGVVLAAHWLLARLHNRESWKAFVARAGASMQTRNAGFGILIVLAMGAALLSQSLGLTFVIGAFYAGILVTPKSVGEQAYKTARSVLTFICWSLFIPLFFAITGLQVNLTVFLTVAGLGTVVALLAVAASSKVGAGAVAAGAQGWSAPDSLAFGFMVNSRGAVEIAMAVILLGDGILSSKLFTLVVAVGMATTILAPIGAMRSWMLTRKSREELVQRMPNLRKIRGVAAGTPIGSTVEP